MEQALSAKRVIRKVAAMYPYDAMINSRALHQQIKDPSDFNAQQMETLHSNKYTFYQWIRFGSKKTIFTKSGEKIGTRYALFGKNCFGLRIFIKIK